MQTDTPSAIRAWAALDVALALLIILGGAAGWFGPVPTLVALVVAAISLWWHGPGWRGIGLRRPPSWPRAIAAGVATGAGYQIVSLYVIEPLVAQLTTGALPDVSMFRPLIGNPVQLLFWVALSWTLAAFVEEAVFRGWLMTRVAQLTGGPAAWTVALVASSAIFGAAHFYQGWSGVTTTGLNGAVFAAAYLACGRNLWVPIIAHGVADTMGFAMIYLGVYPGL
ncbi:MAG: lysostaphin resistance A-like protein [Vicinamibacterales bacterium]